MKTTITDIAQKAGVSKATVSRVLNNKPEGVGAETRLKIQGIIRETGFQPSGVARGLATGKSQSVGLIIPDITNPFYAQLVRGVEDALNQSGYGLFLCNSDRSIEKEKNFITLLIEKEVDGVILNSAESECDCQLETLEKNNIPYVLADRMIERSKKSNGVFVDNQYGAMLAAEYLFTQPGSNMLFINGPADLSQSKQRQAGVEQVFREKGLHNGQLRIIYGDFTLESGYQLTLQVLNDCDFEHNRKNLPFNAVFSANDVMAIGAMRALRQVGASIPEDVEVIGFDDIELAHLLDPPLSTVFQPSSEMGSRSAALLLQIINKKNQRPKTITLMPELVLRGTTKMQQDEEII